MELNGRTTTSDADSKQNEQVGHVYDCLSTDLLILIGRGCYSDSIAERCVILKGKST